jgi:hypothetical protein
MQGFAGNSRVMDGGVDNAAADGRRVVSETASLIIRIGAAARRIFYILLDAKVCAVLDAGTSAVTYKLPVWVRI